MPYPKHYVDGVLLNWGDSLFREPLHRIRAPRIGRVAWPDSAVQVRAQIARTIRRAPEVMVKITNRPGGKRGMKAIRDHLRYISRNGSVEIEDQDSQIIAGTDAIRDLADEWCRSGWGIPEVSRHRESFNVMLSMPPGTNRLAVHDAAGDFAHAEFGENHRYVFAAHDDEAHPHVHLVVQARGYDGRRLNPRKGDLQRWREEFAQCLREHGVEANATPRRTRGVTRRFTKQPVVHLVERGETPIYEPRASSEPGRQDEFLAHRPMLDAWREIGQILAASDSGADRRMGVDVTDFVRQMPVIQTPPTPDTRTVRPHEPPAARPMKRRRQRFVTRARLDEPDIER
jgi:hypothetical protein